MAKSVVWAILSSCFLLLASQSPLGAQQGYSLRNNRVVVDRASHWAAWDIPSHLVRIDGAGAVRARSFRRIYDLLADRSFARPVSLTSKDARIANIDSTQKRDFQGNPVKSISGKPVFDYVVRPGVSRAGSNFHLAKNIVDGDPETFWEPDLDDAPENWWVEVDLGRATPLERVRLFFAAEGLGDPFYRFILLLGPSQINFAKNTPGNMEVFVPFEGVNTDRRVFVFDGERVSEGLDVDERAAESKPLDIADTNKNFSEYYGNPEPSPEWDGKTVEVIRIVVTDTRGGRAEQISAAQWQALPAAERGDIVYFLKDGDYEEPVDQDTYFGLNAARRGEPDYYRRELPRLGAVEAWGMGDEIGQEMLAGGGAVELTGPGNPSSLFDGNWGTLQKIRTQRVFEPGLNVLTMDIGGTIWLDQIRLLSEQPPRGYIIRGSDGARDAQGNLQWVAVTSQERMDNLGHGLYRQLADIVEPARSIRFLELVVFALQGDSKERSERFWPRFREIMLFSSGPPANAILESSLIELPGLFGLGEVRWEATAPPGSEVEIRTRTGDQLLEVVRYYDKTGNEKTAAQHKKLSFTQKGPIDTSRVVGPGWSPWSQKYLNSGDQATSPGLRRFMQLQVRLVNYDRQAVPALKSLSVELLQPVVQQLGAEVWPEIVSAGRLDTFELFVQADFLEQPVRDRSPGFDQILLQADPPIDMRLIEMALGTESELGRDEPELLFGRPHAEGFEDTDGQLLQVLSERDSLWLQLPVSVRSAPAELLPRFYYRQLDPGDEVPTGLDGERLTIHSYSQLPEGERGAVRYFRQVAEGVAEVDLATYEALPEDERGSVRYFRIVTGLGEQSLFSDIGDTLDAVQHRRLNANDRGRVVGSGRLVRLRFASELYLPSTVLRVAVRQSSLNAAWQHAAERDVTALSPARSLAIQAGQMSAIVDDITISPNPFTPNDDGINDAAQIDFSLFQVFVPRPVVLQIYTLAGLPVRRLQQELIGGRQNLAWDGRNDRGERVPPGLYVCQISASTDAEDGEHKRSHLIAVAY